MNSVGVTHNNATPVVSKLGGSDELWMANSIINIPSYTFNQFYTYFLFYMFCYVTVFKKIM